MFMTAILPILTRRKALYEYSGNQTGPYPAFKRIDVIAVFCRLAGWLGSALIADLLLMNSTRPQNTYNCYTIVRSSSIGVFRG